jgi:hypothetical protein
MHWNWCLLRSRKFTQRLSRNVPLRRFGLHDAMMQCIARYPNIPDISLYVLLCIYGFMIDAGEIIAAACRRMSWHSDPSCRPQSPTKIWHAWPWSGRNRNFWTSRNE